MLEACGTEVVERRRLIISDYKCFSSPWNTLFLQTCKSVEDTKKMVKIWQEIVHLDRSAESLDSDSFLLHLQFTEVLRDFAWKRLNNVLFV